MDRLKVSKLGLIIMIATVGLTLIGCATGPEPYPTVNDDAIKKKEYAAMEDHTLIFGYIAREKSVFSFGERKLPIVEFAQINPEGEAMFISPGRSGSFFFIQPVPIDSSLHLIFHRYKEGRTTYYTYEGLQKGYDITINAIKPGLYYAGSYLLQSVGEDSGSWISFIMSPDGFLPNGDHTELEGLKDLLKKMKNTEWEELITARIEELKNES